jgi:hypothetical protein
MATGALVILAVIPPRTTPKTGGVQTDEEANLTSEDDTSRHPMDGGEATHNRLSGMVGRHGRRAKRGWVRAEARCRCGGAGGAAAAGARPRAMGGQDAGRGGRPGIPGRGGRASAVRADRRGGPRGPLGRRRPAGAPPEPGPPCASGRARRTVRPGPRPLAADPRRDPRGTAGPLSRPGRRTPGGPRRRRRAGGAQCRWGPGLRLGPAPTPALAAARELPGLRRVRGLRPPRSLAGAAGGAAPGRRAGPAGVAGGQRAQPEAKRLGSRKFGTSAATACPSGEAKAAPIAAASSNQSSATASWASGDPFGSGSTQFTTNRRSAGSLVTKGRWVSRRCCPKASGLISARRGRSTITFTTLCLLPVGAADPPRCLRPGTLRAGGPNPREHPVLPRPAAGTAYPSDGPGVVNARHRLRPGPIRFAIEARCRVAA